MAPTVVQTRIAVFINDVQVRTTGDVLINESLDSLCRVAEFELAAQPTAEPVEGDTVLVQWLDYDGDLAYDLFGGKINAIEIESDPWSFIVRCTDQLEKLRRVPASDHSFTGQTVKETIEEILDACDVDYDAADLAALSYVLGAEVPVKWLEGVPGSQVAAEINDVFGMTLATIGNNRVIWFRTDLPPADATGKYRDYEKSVDADFNANRRSHGDRDAIQNYWLVNGASIPCGTADACSCQIWAKAIDSNPQLGGRRIRTAPQTSSSDLIQDEALAEYIVRRQMRLTNRLPDTATVETSNDPNVHPGTKVGLIDATYGIDAASARNCTVTAVDRTGSGMTLACMCGTPGEEGTVTTGYQKVCNGTNSDLDLPGSFDPPDFDWPPIDLGTGFDPGDFFLFDPPIIVIGGTPDTGGGGGACLVPVWNVLYGDWVTTDTSAEFTGHSTDLCSVPGSAGAAFSGYVWIGADTYDGTQRVRVTGHVEMDIGVSDPSLFIGLHSTDESGASSGITVTLTEVDFFSWTGFDDDLVDATGGFDFILDWDPDTGNFNAALLYSGGRLVHTQSLGSWPASARVPTIETNGNQCALGVTVTDLCVSNPVDLFISIIGYWVEITAIFNSHLISATAIGPSGYGSDHGHEIDNGADWMITGTFDASSGGAASNIFFGVGDGAGVPAYQATIYVFSGSTAIDLDTRNVSESLSGTAFSDGTLTVELSWDQSSSRLAARVTQGGRVETFSIVDSASTDISGPYYPFMGIGGNGSSQAALTDYAVTP